MSMTLATAPSYDLAPALSEAQSPALADGIRELTAEELALIAGGLNLNFASLERAVLIGAVGGGAGGLITGLFSGGPLGSLAGGAIGALAGAVGGAVTNAVTQLIDA